jgi:hypothetical protein
MIARAQVWIRFRQPGFHNWPGGPDYLMHKHRHLFHVTVAAEAPVDDQRSIEFHELLEQSKHVFMDIAMRGTMYDFGDMSCESIAQFMALRLCRAYQTVMTVSVSEDGECGATVRCDVSDLPAHT